MTCSARIILSCPRGDSPLEVNQRATDVREILEEYLGYGNVRVELEAWRVEQEQTEAA